MKINTELKTNIEFLKSKLKSEDVTFLPVSIKNSNAELVFLNEMVDKTAIGELILQPLSKIEEVPSKDNFFDIFLSPEKQKILDLGDVIDEVSMGNAIILCDKVSYAVSFGLKKFEKRAITEPPTSTVIKGPREGFVESLPINISLMRRRIKSPDLIFENFVIGKYSKTQVSLCYVKGIADKNLVRKIRKKLTTIKIDAILDSSYISKFLGEHQTSIFKQVGNTEKPDILTSKILEGRVAIFVDGSPIVLTVPYLLIDDFQSPSDYYNSAFGATLSRLVRLISVIISLITPAFFVASELFHLQLIPLSFLLTIVNSIKGIPLSPSYEMFFTLLIFEILNEASVRMPKYVGMVVSIVGGLVLGETAINAGIISSPTLMIIALSGICLYTVPELEKVFSIIRLILLIIGGSIGVYGLLLAVAGMIVYLVTFENYSTPLVAPYSPLIASDLKDGFIKGFTFENTSRPFSIKNVNHQKMKLPSAEANKK